MPYTITSLKGRATVVTGLALGVAIFAAWFLAPGPFFGLTDAGARDGAPPEDPQDPVPTVTPARSVPYPLVRPAGPPLSLPGPGLGEPDFDPVADDGVPRGSTRTLPVLLSLLPQPQSLRGMADLARIRRIPYLADILAGRRLCRVRPVLERLGIAEQELERLVFAADLEGGRPTRTASPETRLLGSLDRAMFLLAEGPRIDRPHVLRQFRLQGPLTATTIYSRRVYHRPGGYSLSFPEPRLVAWSYHRPMGPLVQNTLEEQAALALSPAQQALLRRVGIPQQPTAPLPLVTVMWSPRAGSRKVPWPFSRLGGAALRHVVAIADKKGELLHGELHLEHADAAAATRAAHALRYARGALADHRRIRQASLQPLVRSVTIQSEGTYTRVTVQLQPWQVAEILVLLHKLLGCSTAP